MKKSGIILLICFVSLFSVSAQTEFRTILSQIHADSLKKTVEDLVGFDNRLCSKSIGQNKKTAQYIAQRLKNYGVEDANIDSFYVSLNHHFFVGNVEQYMYNAKGRLSGSIKPDSIVIIGAHLDAISYNDRYIVQSTTPGANDNATGIAVMIEVARIFHANNLVPKYSIDFVAYDAEEIGLFGARYDARKRKNANENIYVMLNNDMVGLQSEGGEWKVIFHADAQEIENKAITICSDYTRLLPHIPDNKDSSYTNSDSWAYREIGFKTFYTHEYEDDPHYHTIFDTPERLNYHYTAEITKLHFSLLYDFAIERITEETSIDEPFVVSTFTLFPNPTDNLLKIKHHGGNNAVFRIFIYDYMGREVLQFSNINSSPYSMDVSSLQSGLYIVKIIYDNNSLVTRFMKK